MFNNSTKIIVVISVIIIFNLFVYFSFAPEYSADSLRYVFAGKQLLENFFHSLNEPLFNEETYENAEFHKNTDYSFPKREFFTIIPNLIFYCLSIISVDSLKYLIIVNLVLFSSLFLICNKIYNDEKNEIKFLFLSFIFFGHYQIVGWNIKILPEIMYIFCLVLFLIYLIKFKYFNFTKILILLFLSILIFLIRPQGLIFIGFVLFYLIFKNFFYKNIYKTFFILFLVSFFLVPFVLYLEFNKIFNFPIINIQNTGFENGAVISGWLNYFNGELIYQDVRFNDKKLNLEQKFSYLDILKITSLRLYHFINPYKFYYSPIINLWNIIYFGLLYAVGIYYFLVSKDLFKKNQFIALLIMIMLFHIIFPVTGTFRYQLSLIAVNFVLIFETLALVIKKKNDEKIF